MSYVVQHVLAIRNQLGEGPLWNPEEQALYWVDVRRYAIYRMWPATGRYEAFDLGLPVSCLALRAAGGMLLATARGLALWRPGAAEPRQLVDPLAGSAGARLNDGAVDARGRFWVGSIGEDGPGSLYRLDPDGTLHCMDTDIVAGNGIGWSPDQRTMYVTDSRRRLIYAYDFDLERGIIAGRRPFIATDDEPGVPDGLAVDSAGYLWSARWGGWKIMRYNPQGGVESEIPLPVQYPTSCSFGGARLRTLYITSAWLPLDERQRAAQPQAGDLFQIQTDVRGRNEPRFRG